MAKRKAPATGAGRPSKRSKPSTAKQGFIWKPKQWNLKRTITREVSVLVSRTDRTHLIVKKVMAVDSDLDDDNP